MNFQYEMSYSSINPLTLEHLKSMKPETIFAHGVFIMPNTRFYFQFNDEPMIEKQISYNFVAIRGGIHDWAIYYLPESYQEGNESIAQHGDKLQDDNIIRSLVQCEDSAFEMYRR